MDYKKLSEELQLVCMNESEVQYTFEKACELFDAWQPEEGISMRDVFIRAYVLGREKSLLEAGLNDEDEKIASELKKYFK